MVNNRYIMLYPDFSDFMTAAVRKAESRIESSRAIQVRLATIVYNLLEKGWGVFSTTAGLLTLGAIAFVAAIAAFVATGVGVIVVAVLAIAGFGSYEGLKFLYANKWYPLAIWKVGKQVKPEYELCKYNDDEVSHLVDKTADMIVNECR